jgi:uncharacterized integral membrane protein
MKITSSSMDRTAKAYVNQKIQAQIEVLDEQVLKGEKTAGEIEGQKQTLKSQLTKPKRWRVNLNYLFGGLLLFALILAAIRSMQEQGGLAWLLVIPELPKTVGDLSVLLGPLVAISVAIERLLETIFDSYEQSVRTAADVLAAPVETLDWIAREYQEAYESAGKAAESIGVDATPETLGALDKAEQRLAKAEDRLRSWTDSPEYIAWKRALSIWAGLMVGLVVSVLGDLGMLHTIGIPMPRLLDMLVTGLVVGAGPGPMHALIGILQNGKDALGNLADLAKGKAINEAVVTLQKTNNP